MKLTPSVFVLLALSALAPVLRAETVVSLRVAADAYLRQAAEEGPRAAYLAHISPDATIMFLHAKGRAEIEQTTATRFGADARFHAEPLLIEVSAANDLGYVWGRYRLEFTRKTTGEHVTAYGKFVNVWKNTPDLGWQLFLDNWAPTAGPDNSPAPAAATSAPIAAKSADTLPQAEAHFLHQAGDAGIRAAFLDHIADDGTIMFLGAKGRTAIEKAVDTIPADARIFAKPDVIAEAASHDLGYVWGRYRFEATIDAKPFQADGKFITIWKRQPDGAWRIVLDHGTQDPEPAAAK